MEFQPPSSISQANALFRGVTQQEVKNDIMRIYPLIPVRASDEGMDRMIATTSTSEANDFHEANMGEGYRLLNGQLTNPFQRVAQLFNNKTDPFYLDGSESNPNAFDNVQENLIGHPMGVTELEDPKLTFTSNMVLLKELKGATHNWSDDYLKELFQTNIDKGANYYQKQATLHRADFQNSLQLMKASQNNIVHDSVLLSHIPRGASSHASTKPNYQKLELPSNQLFQGDIKQDQWRRIENVKNQNIREGRLPYQINPNYNSSLNEVYGTLQRKHPILGIDEETINSETSTILGGQANLNSMTQTERDIYKELRSRPQNSADATNKLIEDTLEHSANVKKVASMFSEYAVRDRPVLDIIAEKRIGAPQFIKYLKELDLNTPAAQDGLNQLIEQGAYPAAAEYVMTNSLKYSGTNWFNVMKDVHERDRLNFANEFGLQKEFAGLLSEKNNISKEEENTEFLLVVVPKALKVLHERGYNFPSTLSDEQAVENFPTMKGKLYAKGGSESISRFFDIESDVEQSAAYVKEYASQAFNWGKRKIDNLFNINQRDYGKVPESNINLNRGEAAGNAMDQTIFGSIPMYSNDLKKQYGDQKFYFGEDGSSFTKETTGTNKGFKLEFKDDSKESVPPLKDRIRVVNDGTEINIDKGRSDGVSEVPSLNIEINTGKKRKSDDRTWGDYLFGKGKKNLGSDAVKVYGATTNAGTKTSKRIIDFKKKSEARARANDIDLKLPTPGQLKKKLGFGPLESGIFGTTPRSEEEDKKTRAEIIAELA